MMSMTIALLPYMPSEGNIMPQLQLLGCNKPIPENLFKLLVLVNRDRGYIQGQAMI
jgi:hypothetical protein